MINVVNVHAHCYNSRFHIKNQCYFLLELRNTCTYLCCCWSGALRQEKLELSTQVKKLQGTVDHLQGSLTQVHEEVTQNSEDLCEIDITLIQALRVTLRLFPVIFLQLNSPPWDDVQLRSNFLFENFVQCPSQRCGWTDHFLVSRQVRQKQLAMDQLQYELTTQSRRATDELTALKQRANELELQLTQTRREADEYFRSGLERNAEATSLGNQVIWK